MEEGVGESKASDDSPPERLPRSRRALLKSVEPWRGIIMGTGVSGTLKASSWVLIGGFFVGGHKGMWKVVLGWVGVGGGGRG